MHSTIKAYIDVISNWSILLDNMNKFHCKSNTLTLLKIWNGIPEIYLHQINLYARSNVIFNLNSKFQISIHLVSYI